MPWATDILKKHGLKKSEARIKTLEFLGKRNSAVSHNDLELELGDSIDRITLYRILSAFEEKGIIHGIATLKAGTQYALCSHCTENNHVHNHLHFNCGNCQRTFCLNNVAFTNPVLPAGFILKEFNLSASGICQECSGS